MSETTKMTQDAYDRVQADVEQLEDEGRREIAARIKTAREWGDLKENAEYHAAKEEAAMLEAKIARMREQLRTSEVVEMASGEEAGLGSKVTFTDQDNGRESSFELVSANEADPKQGKISPDSPMGKALAGSKPGDTRTLDTPSGGRSLKIVSVEQA